MKSIWMWLWATCVLLLFAAIASAQQEVEYAGPIRWPIELTAPDGKTVIANSREEVDRLIAGWYKKEVPTSTGKAGPVVPQVLPRGAGNRDFFALDTPQVRPARSVPDSQPFPAFQSSSQRTVYGNGPGKGGTTLFHASFAECEYDPDHICNRCGTEQLVIARWNRDGTHTHICPQCGHAWRH